MSHILVSVSTMWAGRHLLDPLVSLAKRLDAGITVLHVLPRGGGNPAQRLQEGRGVVSYLCDKLSEHNITCYSRLAEPTDDLAGLILDAAREVGATLIFIGISGKSPFARTAGGDVPIQLIRRTTIPILLLPPALNVKL